MNTHGRMFRNLHFILIAMALLLFAISGCSGYRLVSKDNPFKEYEISSISVPVFENQSILPQVSAPFTQAIVGLLSEYRGLRLVAGLDTSADAILLGTVTGPKKLSQTLRPAEGATVKGIVGGASSIGDRPDFVVPGKTEVNLGVRFLLIKNPLPEDLVFIKSELAENSQFKHPKVFLDVSFALQETFERTLYGGSSDGLRGMEVNATQNRGKVERAVSNLAKSSADKFRELILGVF